MTDDQRLTHRSAVRLAADIREGTVTSAEVVEAHIEVLQRIGRLHAVAAERYDLARNEAAAADKRVSDGELDLPPLHGVPVTIKEMLAVEGMPNTGGYPHRRKHRAERDATVVRRLRDAGAIVLAVGNTAGAFVWFESNNWLYGRAANAYDPSRTAGGSTGGDGAIVGSGGAPVALGSDLGGSVRIPAYLNGVFGHLPSPGFAPLTGHYPAPQGTVRRMLYPGVLARRAEDLAPVLQIIAGPDGVDEWVTEQPQLGDPAAVSIVGLPIVVSHDSGTPLAPPLRTAIDAAARELAARGAQVREQSLRQLRWAFAQFTAVVAAEFDFLASWQGLFAPIWETPGRTPPSLLVRAPAALLKVVEAAPLRHARTAAVGRLVDAAHRAQDEVAQVIGAGALLYPPFPREAPKHRRTLGQPWLAINTALFNLYGLPATQTPLGLGPAGFPLGLQVAAAAGNDHVCIAVATELERAFGGWVDPADR